MEDIYLNDLDDEESDRLYDFEDEINNRMEMDFSQKQIYNDNGIEVGVSQEYFNFTFETKKYFAYLYFGGTLIVYKQAGLDEKREKLFERNFNLKLCDFARVNENKKIQYCSTKMFDEKIDRILNLGMFL